MTGPRVAASYRARDGNQHDVLVLRTPAGRWRVLDACDHRVVHVETLTGYDDRLSQASALAEDYAKEEDAYHSGERLDDPLPRRRPDPPDEGDETCAA
ncbi:hypothetical protein C8N24_0654 [Solirubrobacter pauli]|uniref:Uncharacterized protein n=1 Tax=Solirubrobacter pauli TaxID=166793 RepID=A0A660L8J7_9ACTN|nr:hypothetical protein [Solirubrobacter pauli]RKQ90839.1 hypothetical protein C8N24_0654 [Solirubrobacter pauli]